MPGTRTTQESPTRAALQALRSFIMAIDRNAAAGGWQKGPRSTLRGNRDPVTVAKYVQWLRALETVPDVSSEVTAEDVSSIDMMDPIVSRKLAFVFGFRAQ